MDFLGKQIIRIVDQETAIEPKDLEQINTGMQNWVTDLKAKADKSALVEKLLKFSEEWWFKLLFLVVLGPLLKKRIRKAWSAKDEEEKEEKKD